MAVDVLPATPDRFDDVAALLGSARDQGCWCLYWRLTSGEFSRVPDRPGRVRELLAGEPAPGLLAYADGTVAGWCGLAPRADHLALTGGLLV